MKKLILTLTVLLCLAPLSAQEYTLAGPYEVIARDGQYRSTKGGSERDMKAALDLAQAGRTDEAARIIHAYAGTLQRLEGHDAPLCTIQGYDLVRAMTLCRAHSTADWDAMVRRAFLPVLNRFEADSPYANGNWGAIVNRMRMACAIYLQDSTLYRAAIDYFYHANDNGSLPRYISPTGQSQETGRDQGHVQLGLEALAQTCEMAWQQGDDLWGALDNRLMAGFEYCARYNLGYDVPFTTWTDCTGLYNDWTEPGPMSRGKLWDIYQLPYDHYVGRRGLSMPYTAMALDVLAGKRHSKVKEYAKLHQAYPSEAPEGAPLKHDYDVFIQPRGSNTWTRIDTYMAKVNAAPLTADGTPAKHRVSQISYACFDFTGDVFVKVVCKHRKYRSVKVRPDYKGVIANVQNDSTVQFLLFQPENVSVEFDGDITDNLLLFTSKPCLSEQEARRQARRAGQTFVYVAPGFYGKDRLASLQALLPGDAGTPAVADVTPSSAPVAGTAVRVPSHTLVYLAPGSYVEGTLAIEDAQDVSICGRGICRPADGYEGVHIHRSSHVVVDGVTLCTCPIGESHDVTLHDVRSVSHPSWGDGLNVFGGSSDILFDRVFCRNSDDCTTAYATRKGFKGSVHNVRMTNSTLWADVAHPIFIGLHGDAAHGDSITHLQYDNIDILCQSEPQLDYQGCLAINCGDNNLVRDVLFDNIRIENLQQGSILQVKVGYNQKYCAAPGRGVEDVTFRGIRYYGHGGQQGIATHEPYMSLILGYDTLRTVRGITFEGLKIDGRAIYDGMPGKPGWYKTADMAKIYCNDLVRGIRFAK